MSSIVPEKEGSKSTALKAGSVGVMGILFFVLSAQAPLTGIAGASPLAVALGNGAGAPGAYLLIGIVIIIFAVGFIAMSRKVQTQGAFYAYVTEGLGRRLGAGSAWLALMAYATVQAAMYGLFGAVFSGLFSSWTGVSLPWWLFVLLCIAFVQVLGSLNIEFGAKILAVLVALEFALLLAFALSVLFNGGGPQGLDFAASFSPAAIAAGAPGVAIMFAVASMFGFESTAIYSAEAKDPKKTVARATYLSVSVIAIFFSFMMWMIVSYYGPDNVVDAAGKALQSGDSTSFLFNPIADRLGPWAATVGGILLLTSLLAGIVAFHNGINRYVHSLALRNSLPSGLARTNKHHAPFIAAWLQTAMAIVLIGPFVALQLDPVLTLFSWFSGIAVAALLVLYVLSSIAVIRYFSKNPQRGKAWQTRVAPVVATVLIMGVLGVLVSNFPTLIGGDWSLSIWLLISVPIAFIIGVLVDAANKKVASEVAN